MANQDKPGYKEIFFKNYIWPAIFALVLGGVAAWEWFSDGYTASFYIMLFFAAVFLFTFFYGRYKYRKDFRNEIKSGERDRGW